MSNQLVTLYGIQSTAGAVPVRNEKGDLSMQKVKVHRYISGKRPEYAQFVSSDDDSDNNDFADFKKPKSVAFEPTVEIDQSVQNASIDDPRLKRLQLITNKEDNSSDVIHSDSTTRRVRRRSIHEPEIFDFDDTEQNHEEDPDDVHIKSKKITLGSDSESETDLSDSEIERRRMQLRQRMLQHNKNEEVLQKEEEKGQESSDYGTSDYEEDSQSGEENEPRLKPLFVSKRERVTIIEKERELAKQKQIDIENKKTAKERRRQTLRMVEESIKKDLEKVKPINTEPSLDDVCTDDENDEVEYEAWKLRELKRIKREREEKELLQKERLETERLRNMTDEERRQEIRLNPKVVTNKAIKGKYKFLQKYFHRGAFYLDAEDDVLKRDFAQATLEDHFDKSILPKVMQVKNFGRCGRTKYTHLVDQDTTQFDSPWYSDTTNNVKFHNEKAGGMKQVFTKPGLSKRKKEI